MRTRQWRECEIELTDLTNVMRIESGLALDAEAMVDWLSDA